MNSYKELLEMEEIDLSDDIEANGATSEEGHEAVELQLTNELSLSKPTTVPLKVWITLMISCLGGLMSSVSSTALMVVFRQILDDLNSSIATMIWVKIMLMIVIGCTVGIVGKLGDLFGQSFLYKLGLFVFTLGSLMGGLSSHQNNGLDLLASRVVAGLGATFLFINSTAILATAFAPYNKVGLAQGMFQISTASGMVLGPVVGGGLGALDWRWIYFWCVPVGGVCALLSLWAVEEPREVTKVTLQDFAAKFDFIGAIFYPVGLCLIFISMIQAVQPQPPLDQKNPLIIMITVATVCGIIFLVDQFLAVDPLFPPRLFRKRIFVACNMANTCMSFVRQSVTNAYIFYLQGPKHMTPLNIGIALIPFGVGVIIAGFSSGAISDFFYPAVLSVSGCIVMTVALAISLTLDEASTLAEIEVILFLLGVGYGLFQSPNTMSLMICVDKNHRGVAAALNYLTQMFTSILGVVLTYNLVLNTMTDEQIADLFVHGNKLPQPVLVEYLAALRIDYYIMIAMCLLALICSLFNNTASKKNENEDIRSLYAPSIKMRSEVNSRRYSAGTISRYNNINNNSNSSDNEEVKEEYYEPEEAIEIELNEV